VTRLLSALQSVVRRAPGTLVVLTVVLTAILGGVATQAVQEQGFENFSPDNEVTAALETIGEEFSAGVDQILVVVERSGPLVSPEGVEAARTLRSTLEDEPAVSDVLAPIPDGAIITYVDGVEAAASAQELDAADLDRETLVELHAATLDASSDEEAEQLRRLLATPRSGQADDGSDAQVGAVVVLLDGQASDGERELAVEAIAEAVEDVAGVEVSVFDFRLLADDIGGAIEADLLRLLGLAFALIIVLLIAIYRRPVDVLASLFGLVFTIVWMQGISTLLGPGFLGWTGGMSEMSMAIPILLVGLGVDYGIHLTMRYREERASHGGTTAAASGAIGAVGAALALATMTTAVGFLTNLVNPLPPLRDFGVFAAVGVASAFLIMTTFVPAVRLVVDRWRLRRGRLPDEPQRGDEAPTLLGRIASSLAPTATHRPWAVLAVAAVLTVAGIVSSSNLSTEFSQTEFFPDDHPSMRTIDLVEDAFGGDLTERTQVLLQGDIDQPGVVAALDRFERDLREVPGVRAANGRAETDSLLTRATTLQLLLSAPPPDGGELDAGVDGADPDAPAPDADAMDPEAIGTFLEAAERAGIGGTPDDEAALRPLADAVIEVDPSAGAVVSDDALLVTVATTAGESIDDLRQGTIDAAAPLSELGLEVTVASENILVADVMDELQRSQITGLGTTLLVSMLLLAVAFWFRVREPVLGVLAIASVGVVVAWVLGLMAAVGIPFNVMTAMVSALAIGIGVPFGIHVVNRFLEDREREPDLATAMRSTLRNTGGALVGSATTTIAGFGSLVLSSVPPFRQFGAVTAMTIGLALLSSIVVLPAMLSIYEQVRRRRASASAGSRGADGPQRDRAGDEVQLPG
jgi:predicted RND superfamily exporter protein